jgi:WD40 repeat protein
VFEADTGELIHRIAEDQGTPMAATMSRDGTRLATFGTNFRGSVWDLGGLRPEGISYITNSTPRPHMAASAARGGSTIAVWGGGPREGDELWETTVLDLETGEQLRTVTGGAPALSSDGRLLAYRVVERVPVTEDADVHPRVGAVRVIDVSSGDLVTEIEVTCHTILLPADAVSDGCPISVGGETWDLEFSPDGRLLGMADSYTDIVYVWDVATGELVGQDQRPGANMRAVAFSPDGRQAVALTAGGDPDHRLRVYGLDPFVLVASVRVEGGNTFTEMVFTPDGALLVAASSDGTIALFDTATWEAVDPIPARHGTTLDVAISDSGSLIASAGEDGSVRVWNVSDRSLVTEIKLDVDEIPNVEFIDDTHLFVTAGFGNKAIVITLDPDELLLIARDRIVRTFTPEECARFEIDPCPTLAQLKSGSA